jgi:hypothetical protein
MDDFEDLEKMRKEATVACFKILPQHFPEGLKKTARNVRTCNLWDLPSTKQGF